MSINSKAKRDRKKKAQLRKQHTSGAYSSQLISNHAQVLENAHRRLFKNLTTPSAVTERVIEFCRIIGDQSPVFLDCEPEPWSRQSCCDSNVLEYMKSHGGEMLCGYRIWFNDPTCIEGERHAIWKGGDVIRDVSFVDTGETRTLFLPDDSGFEGGFDEAPPKRRMAFSPHDKALLAEFEAIEAQVPSGRMSRDEAWRRMLTYEDWRSGKRMNNAVWEQTELAMTN